MGKLTDLVRKYEEAEQSSMHARGEAENRIKEAQLDLFGTRASCHRFNANQMRLMIAALAYTLMPPLPACVSATGMPVAVAEEESSLSSISTSTSSIGSITSYSRSNVTNLYNQNTRHFTPLQLFQNTI